MRKILFWLCFSLVFFTGASGAFAGFDDVLKDVLIESTRTIGNEEYVFRPGDEIVSKQEYKVIYSGAEENGGVRTLLLSLLVGDNVFVLKYPSPDVIQVKDIALQVNAFSNTTLKVSVLRQGQRRY